MKRNLINRKNLAKHLKKKGYFFFSDEQCRIVTVDLLDSLFVYKYFGLDDLWSFWIDEKKLFCENIGGMIVAFPLHEK